ncbi:lipocalin family protein [Piscinibacter sakaiensis]|uniref:lipocalin family protein n=1 Tax=Piscinibacter sakaiensis TaxID=1547922 RepID=UPI00372996CF
MSAARRSRRQRLALLVLAGGAVALAAACASAPSRPPVTLAPQVDLARFMGDWYVIGHIPTWPEREAVDAVERYDLRPDGRIQTTFTYRNGALDAPLRTMRPVGTVVDRRSNAVWTMQFLWPFEADYRVMRLAPDYSHVVIGREKRDYVWIMARTPTLPDATWRELVDFVAAEGYDVTKMRRVPQQPGGRGG